VGVNPWLSVWSRAVIGPASRRAGGVWVGAVIVAAVIFGPTGMQPADLTGLALHVPAVAAVLALTWLLVYLPIARVIVRADAAAYLRSLPGANGRAALLGGLAIIGFQFPWLLLWTIGDGARGAALVGGWTIVIVLLARWRPMLAPPRTPVWTHDGQAMRGVHVRALRRRAADALLRGTGLALLAGGAAGLFVRNNGVVGADAAVLGTCVIAVVLVPAQVGVLLVLIESHRQSAWLAASLGIARGTRVVSLAFAIALVHLAATVLAVIAAALVIGPDAATFGLLALTSLVAAIGSALGETRALLGAEHLESVASRTVSGAVVVAAVVVLCLGTLGIAGLLAILATGVVALASVKP
jgi:hypothetical protein